jgi:hypothetical protein
MSEPCLLHRPPCLEPPVKTPKTVKRLLALDHKLLTLPERLQSLKPRLATSTYHPLLTLLTVHGREAIGRLTPLLHRIVPYHYALAMACYRELS